MKGCRKCGVETDSRRGVCKPCWAAYMRDYYARNPDKAKAARQRRKESGQKREDNRRYRTRHPEKAYASRRASEAKRAEHYKAYKQAWYRAHKGKAPAPSRAAEARRRPAAPAAVERRNGERAGARQPEAPREER